MGVLNLFAGFVVEGAGVHQLEELFELDLSAAVAVEIVHY
jgi:hypothetical protein